MEELIEEIKKNCELSKSAQTLLRQTVRELHFPKGSVVIGEGKIDDSLYFILRGVWRAHVSHGGEQLTLWFATAGEMVFSSWGYGKGAPSRLTLSSSSDSMVAEIKKSTVQKLTVMSPSFAAWLQDRYIDLLIATDDALVDISSPRAEKRYLTLLRRMPELFQSVPLKEIAGFIGVTPQSLSRIRAGLSREQDK